MTSLTFTECCQRLAVTPKTLRKFLAQAEMSLHPHPADARITCLTSEQLQQLATLHDRVLHPSGHLLGSSELPPGETIDVDLRTRLAQLEAQVATLQTQLTDLTLQLLREGEQRTEQRLLALEAECTFSEDRPSVSFSGAPSSVSCQPVVSAPVPSYGEAEPSHPTD